MIRGGLGKGKGVVYGESRGSVGGGVCSGGVRGGGGFGWTAGEAEAGLEEGGEGAGGAGGRMRHPGRAPETGCRCYGG